MTIAVIGTGRTGQHVVDLLGSECGNRFNSTNLPTLEALQQHNGVIIFVPASAVESIMPIVLQSGIPAIWGSTGVTWPDNLDAILQQQGCRWLLTNNCCLSMGLIRQVLQLLGNLPQYYDRIDWHLSETHHHHKQDAPSGTAKSWREWLGQSFEIESIRSNDVCGEHQLTIRLPYETITLTHQAHSRAVFAEGAIWAMQRLLSMDKMGVLTVQDVLSLE